MTNPSDWMPPHLRPDGDSPETQPVASEETSAKGPLRELQDLLWPEEYTPRQVVIRTRLGAAVALVEALWPLALVTPSELPAVALRSALFLLAAAGMWRRKTFGPVLAMGTTACLLVLALLSDSKVSVGFFAVYLSLFNEARCAIQADRARGTTSA